MTRIRFVPVDGAPWVLRIDPRLESQFPKPHPPVKGNRRSHRRAR